MYKTFYFNQSKKKYLIIMIIVNYSVLNKNNLYL